MLDFWKAARCAGGAIAACWLLSACRDSKQEDAGRDAVPSPRDGSAGNPCQEPACAEDCAALRCGPNEICVERQGTATCECGPGLVLKDSKCIEPPQCFDGGCDVSEGGPAIPDSSIPDASGRILEDGGPKPTPAATSAQIAAVRAVLVAVAIPTALDALPIQGAIVSYIKPGFGAAVGTADGPGFFIQNEDTGPGLLVAADPATIIPDGLRVGDRLDLIVMEGFASGQRLLATKATARLVGEGAVLPMAQPISDLDLAPIVDQDWAQESELIRCTATIADVFTTAGPGFVAAQITTTGEPAASPDFLLRVPADWVKETGAAKGCTIAVSKTPLWGFNTKVQVSAWKPKDATVTCPPLAVTGTYPADKAVNVPPSSTLRVTFSQPIQASALVTQAASGPCAGNVQISADSFATCLSFLSDETTLDPSGTIATLKLSNELAVATDYGFRVMSGIRSVSGSTLASNVTASFRTSAALPSCESPVVISQVYGGGGSSGAPFTNDFVELHNRAATAIDLTGWSIQYASAAGTTWQTFALPSVSLGGGAYYLVQLSTGGATGVALDSPDAIGGLNMSNSSGKVALVSTTTALGPTLPTGAPLVDLVGYGNASQAEGAAAPLLSGATAAIRGGNGCNDTNSNSADFTAEAPSPRNSKTSQLCACAGK